MSITFDRLNGQTFVIWAHGITSGKRIPFSIGGTGWGDVTPMEKKKICDAIIALQESVNQKTISIFGKLVTRDPDLGELVTRDPDLGE